MTDLDLALRVQRFNTTTGALRGGNTHPDRCVCQTLPEARPDTPHKHYEEPPHACARCGCEAYQPALLELPPPPLAGHYRVHETDPPWPECGGGKIRRGANRHFKTMKVRDIVEMFERKFSVWSPEDAHLYVWVTNNYLPAGLRCIDAAGFRYVTMVTWVKDRKGLGQYYRGRTEHCLFAVRGHLPYLIDASSNKRAQGETVLYYPEPSELELPEPALLPSAFEAPRQKQDGKDKHSKKPPQMRKYIELVSGGHGPMLESFARNEREGWDSWGDELAA